MSKQITVIYNGVELITKQLVTSSAIHYNGNIIQEDFIGTKILKCNRNIMDDDIYIDAFILPCKNLTMASDIKVIAEWDYIYVGPKPSSPSPVVYDGTIHTNGFDISSKSGIELSGIGSATDAGSYTAIYTLMEGYAWDDETTTPVTVVMKINQKSIENAVVTLGPTLIYSGEAQTQTISKIIVDNLEVNQYTVTGNTGTTVGTYTLTCTGNTNFTGTVSTNWNISKLQLTIPELTDIYKTYIPDITQQPTVVNFNNIWENQSGTASAINASNYNIYWDLKDTANTEWNNGTTSQKGASWTINKATGTCSGGTNVNPTYNGSAQQIITGCTGTGIIEYSLDKATWSTTPISQTNAGTYTVYYRAQESSNYNTSAIAEINCTITAATIDSISLSLYTTVFNNTTQTVSVTSVKSGTLVVPSSDYTVSGTISAFNVSTNNEVIVRGKNNFTGEKSAYWSITALSIDTFTLNTELRNYTGSTQSVSVATLSGNGITCLTYNKSGTWSAIDGGTYTATVTGTGNFTGSLSKTWKIQYVWNKYTWDWVEEGYQWYNQGTDTTDLQCSITYKIGTAIPDTPTSLDPEEQIIGTTSTVTVSIPGESDFYKTYPYVDIQNNYDIFYVTSVTEVETSTYWKITGTRLTPETAIIKKKQDYIGQVTSLSISTYPEDGTVDNYWYAKTW